MVDHCVLCWVGGFISFGLLPGFGMAKLNSSTRPRHGGCGHAAMLDGDFQGVV